MNPVEDRIQRELSYLDLNLFLDFDRHPIYGFLYYSVKQQMQDGTKPLTVVDWCVGDTPLPLSEDIVDRVRAQEGDLRESIAQATVNNAARQELLRQERLTAQDEIAQEFHKWDKRGFVKLPTGITSSD